MSYLQRLPTGEYQLRKSIPAALSPILGKRELVKRLGTRDVHVAKRRAVAALSEVDRILDEARRALTSPEVAGILGSASTAYVGRSRPHAVKLVCPKKSPMRSRAIAPTAPWAGRTATSPLRTLADAVECLKLPR
jgi:hypothetical protein